MRRRSAGTGRFEIVYGFVREIEIGGIKVKNVPVYIREFHQNSHEVDGYIGISLISKFLTTVDYGDKKFSLVRKQWRAARRHPLQSRARFCFHCVSRQAGF
jgi:hypothetical protein